MSKPVKGKRTHLFFTVVIVFLGIIATGMMVYNVSVSNFIHRNYLPLIDASMNIRLNLAYGRLWLEELLAGDEQEELRKPWRYFDEAVWYARVFLDGGEKDGRLFYPIDDERAQLLAKNLLMEVEGLRQFAGKRSLDPELNKVGFEVDQEFDELFRALHRDAVDLENQTRRLTHAKREVFVNINYLLIVLLFFLFAFVAQYYFRMEKQRSSHFLEMLQARNDLENEVESRKKVEAALRENQARINSIFLAVPIGVSLIKKRVFCEVNDHICQMIGYQPSELINQNTSILYESEAEYKRVGEMIMRAEDKPGQTTLETRWKHKNGSLIDVLMSTSPLNPDNLDDGIIDAVMDISDRKAYEKERSRFIEDLESRQAELERFTYTVSHDLRSPLITIKGFLGILEDDVRKQDEERAGADIKRIERAADTMGALLDDLLELSRIGRVNNAPQQINMHDLAEEVRELMTGPLENDDVVLEIDERLKDESVFGDYPRIREVLQNLVENGIKFMGKQENPRISICCCYEHSQRIFSVRDNGSGIDPKYHEKIFGLFDRLDQSGSGSGIGLPIVRRIIEIHGGEIWVESDGLENQGTTFFFTLPETEKEADLTF